MPVKVIKAESVHMETDSEKLARSLLRQPIANPLEQIKVEILEAIAIQNGIKDRLHSVTDDYYWVLATKNGLQKALDIIKKVEHSDDILKTPEREELRFD